MARARWHRAAAVAIGVAAEVRQAAQPVLMA